MGAYENNLRHVAEPASPDERERAVSTTIRDYEALFLTEVLREFAHYGDHDDERQGGIAVAYAAYIDKQVRANARSYIDLYAHTDVAAETLLDALYEHCPPLDERDDYPMTLFRSMEDSFAVMLAHYIEGSDLSEPPAPTEFTS